MGLEGRRDRRDRIDEIDDTLMERGERFPDGHGGSARGIAKIFAPRAL